MHSMGHTLIYLGMFLLIIGVLLVFMPKFQLPGDILIQRKNFTVYIPIMTSIVLSIIFTVVLNLFFRK